MAMVITIDTPYEMWEQFNRMGRGDSFSECACEELLDYYDEVGEPIEFDAIGLCCDWTEYTEIEDFIDDYGNTFEDWLENDTDLIEDWAYDNDIEDDLTDEQSTKMLEELYAEHKDEWLDYEYEKLKWETTILECRNGNFVVATF